MNSPAPGSGAGALAPRGAASRSIRARLSAVFALFLALVLALALFGIHTLGEVNEVSAEIRQHWLQTVRLLGDLSNFMSDYRSAEATRLLSATPEELARAEADLAAVDAAVRRTAADYEALAGAGPERARYLEFARQWQGYQDEARTALGQARTGRRDEAVRHYLSASRTAFDAASATLSTLTDETVRGANEATARAQATYVRAKRLIWLAMGVATTLLVVAIAYLTRFLTDPLLDIARRMRELAAQRTDIDIPGTERADEMGDIARSVTVFRDNAVALITTQRRLLEQASALESALEHERRIASEQRNFVSMTSHEFRTPLTIIDGHAQRLLKTRERVDPEEIEERALGIRGAVLRMTSIMDGLLGASRLLDGGAVCQRVPVALGPMVHEVCQMHRELAQGVRITESVEPPDAALAGDPTLLFQAVSNLVSNAVKYSPPGGLVEVRAGADATTVWVAVADTGRGICAADQPHVFERYFRGRNAGGISGTGVGLHLVSLVASLHGGSVDLQSAEGSGATFTLRLPRAAP